MEKGYFPWSWISDKNQTNPREAEKIFGYACKNCGYVEFYLKEKKNRIKENRSKKKWETVVGDMENIRKWAELPHFGYFT